ncbi:MAG TPA: hypothetical protein VIH05_06685 [Tepidiformaceae bacterium]
MNEEEARQAAARFRQAVDMWEFGMGMMFAKLRREHPEETDEQLRARLRAQLDDRPLDRHLRRVTADHPRWGYLVSRSDEPG